MSKGLRFQLEGKVNGYGDNIYFVKYPSYFRIQSQKALLADHLNTWTREFIAENPVKGWKGLYHGVNLNLCNRGNHFEFYTPNDMPEDRFNGLVAYANKEFFEVWEQPDDKETKKSIKKRKT